MKTQFLDLQTYINELHDAQWADSANEGWQSEAWPAADGGGPSIATVSGATAGGPLAAGSGGGRW